jgi:rubredoxin
VEFGRWDIRVITDALGEPACLCWPDTGYDDDLVCPVCGTGVAWFENMGEDGGSVVTDDIDSVLTERFGVDVDTECESHGDLVEIVRSDDRTPLAYAIWSGTVVTEDICTDCVDCDDPILAEYEFARATCDRCGTDLAGYRAVVYVGDSEDAA